MAKAPTRRDVLIEQEKRRLSTLQCRLTTEMEGHDQRVKSLKKEILEAKVLIKRLED